MSEQPFRDAEAWLAERGVRRDPIRVRLEEPEPPENSGPSAPPAPGSAAATPEAAAAGPEPSDPSDSSDRSDPSASAATTSSSAQPPPPEAAESSGLAASESAAPGAPVPEPAGEGAPVGATEAQRLAAASADEQARRLDEASAAHRDAPRLEDEVADAAAFVRRSTASAPQAETRLVTKLRERGWSEPVVEQALRRCRAAGLVDDEAMAAALVEEGRRKGHAPTRLRADLRRRELPDDIIERALEPVTREDPEAAAFAVARQKADTLTAVDAETAFRRVVGHLARRGHPEALARKVARAAVFDARDPERTAGH